ncbi:undecaprenyl-phosphate alpha-N-acetylglucosaminyl 1-phosphate transferase [Mucilaginibacter xinganensis]|uniref:Undecaprenyl-phosphate alpha-N-acetylglucosaminyl 1-phosphate transferase n=2 Tax=Mucilaginibacter xinganensis TaxID=1234841 RepID=A0A223P4B7_9SPHI|nr:undecaprenyl-phosphate alpha-N-acetylglucosaminyl 1-phosphate transferase [Mucilaginibacter xinganensis]
MEFLHNYTYIYYVFIIAVSTIITTFAIPSILHVARFRHLYDDLGHFRKEHDHGIPRLGGVAIFVGFTITSLLFCMTDKSLPINYLLTACIILFAMGLKDDLSGVNSNTKFVIQFVVCAILVILGNIRLTGMYGVFGIYELPYVISAGLSILLILLVVNAFNLIDGIDGLAATTGIIANGAFAILFIYIKQYELAAVSFAMAGSILGFLRFNLTPAKIFMGDTGSLLIGLISAVMALKFIEVNMQPTGKLQQLPEAPAITIAILIGPIFDTIRVFVIRIVNGGSPFVADRNHIHHRMLKLGLNHLQTTLILTGANILTIFIILLLKDYSNSFLIVLIVLMSLAFNWVITFFIRSKEREGLAFRNLFI